MKFPNYSIQGIKRERANRYDRVSISHDGEIITICAREGGDAGGYADLTPEAARKLVRALHDVLFDMGEAG